MNMSHPLQIFKWKRFRELSIYLQDFLWHPMVNSSMYDVYKNWLMAEKSSRPNLLITGSATVSFTIRTSKPWQSRCIIECPTDILSYFGQDWLNIEWSPCLNDNYISWSLRNVLPGTKYQEPLALIVFLSF